MILSQGKQHPLHVAASIFKAVFVGIWDICFCSPGDTFQKWRNKYCRVKTTFGRRWGRRRESGLAVLAAGNLLGTTAFPEGAASGLQPLGHPSWESQ